MSSVLQAHQHLMCKQVRNTAIAGVQQRIAEASTLVERAEAAYHSADGTAEPVRAAAEKAHLALLESLCRLTESEADAVEPAFTEFESGLLRLSLFAPRS